MGTTLAQESLKEAAILTFGYFGIATGVVLGAAAVAAVIYIIYRNIRELWG